MPVVFFKRDQYWSRGERAPVPGTGVGAGVLMAVVRRAGVWAGL